MITLNECMPCPQCKRFPVISFDPEHTIETIREDGKTGYTNAPRFIFRCFSPNHDHMVMAASLALGVQFWNRYVQGLLLNVDLLKSHRMTKTEERIFNSAHGIDPKEAA